MKIMQLWLDKRKRHVTLGRDLSTLELTYHGREHRGGRIDKSRDTAHRWVERCIEWLFAYLWKRFAKLHARVWFTETKEDVIGTIIETRPLDDLLTQIRVAERQLAEMWDKRVNTLIISHHLYLKLQDEVYRTIRGAPFSYWDETRIGYRGIERVVRLNIIVVPWLEGWALLPKIE